jgi:hypothetical protein
MVTTSDVIIWLAVYVAAIVLFLRFFKVTDDDDNV